MTTKAGHRPAVPSSGITTGSWRSIRCTSPCGSSRARGRTAGLFELLVEKEVVVVAAGADRAGLMKRFAAAISKSPRNGAVDRVLALLDGDDAVEEVFADEDVLRVTSRHVAWPRGP